MFEIANDPNVLFHHGASLKQFLDKTWKGFKQEYHTAEPGFLCEKFGYFVTDLVLGHYTCKGLGKLGQIAKSSKLVSQTAPKLIATYTPQRIQQLGMLGMDIARSTGQIFVRGRNQFRKGMHALNKAQHVLRNQSSFYRSLEYTFACLQGQAAYHEAMCVYNNYLLNGGATKLAQKLGKTTLPAFFIAYPEAITVGEDLVHATDPFGNVLKIPTKAAGEFTLECSNEGKKAFALLNESIHDTGKATANGCKDLGGSELPKSIVKNNIAQKVETSYLKPSRMKPEWRELSKTLKKQDKIIYEQYYRGKTVGEFVGEKVAPKLGNLAEKQIVPNGVHRFEPLVKLKKQGGKMKYDKIHGFHTNLSQWEKVGMVEVLEKKTSETGVVSARIKIGKVQGKKTFFPESWPDATITEKIKEACTNYIDIDPKGGGVKILGVTNDGVKIEVIIGSNGQIKTAYPWNPKI